MRIGVTECGDAGINLDWISKVDTVDGMILITKNLTEEFKSRVLDLYHDGYKIIVHCTCTGYGGSKLEPNVPEYQAQLTSFKDLIYRGFPAENCVLRIDPIFPSEKGIERVENVLDYFATLKTGVDRVRVSIVDEYKHVKSRYYNRGWIPMYGGDFGPSFQQIKMVADSLNHYPYTFETCAEAGLARLIYNSEIIGCVSNKDLQIMGLYTVPMTENPQNRMGCHCLSCKTELLAERKPCKHGCVYCYWR